MPTVLLYDKPQNKYQLENISVLLNLKMISSSRKTKLWNVLKKNILTTFKKSDFFFIGILLQFNSFTKIKYKQMVFSGSLFNVYLRTLLLILKQDGVLKDIWIKVWSTLPVLRIFNLCASMYYNNVNLKSFLTCNIRISQIKLNLHNTVYQFLALRRSRL